MLGKGVTGVAITGSLARLERYCHDVDLVVFHDGTLEDGSCRDPDTTRQNYSDMIPLTALAPPGIARRLTQARMGVPVDYLCVDEKILWDCNYLHSREEVEEYSEFHRRVFCDLPLILLDPYQRRGELLKHTEGHKIFLLERGVAHMPPGLSYPGMRINHVCNNQSCLPRKPWKQCRDEIRKRKNHHWHE